MADYNNNNKTFTDALYGTRANQDVVVETALTNAFGSPPPLTGSNNGAQTNLNAEGRGGFFNLSAYNNSFSLVSASSVSTFASDPVVGVLYNLLPGASGQHVSMHHLEDPVTGGGNAGVNTHAAATIRFAGNYFNGGEHAKHRRIALITKSGNTVSYTIDKHESSHHRHTFTATGSAGSGFDNSINTGLFIVKNTPESEEILNKWAYDDDLSNLNLSCWDQGVVNKMYVTNTCRLRDQSVVLPYNVLQNFDKETKHDPYIRHLAGPAKRTHGIKKMFRRYLKQIEQDN